MGSRQQSARTLAQPVTALLVTPLPQQPVRHPELAAQLHFCGRQLHLGPLRWRCDLAGHRGVYAGWPLFAVRVACSWEAGAAQLFNISTLLSASPWTIRRDSWRPRSGPGKSRQAPQSSATHTHPHPHCCCNLPTCNCAGAAGAQGVVPANPGGRYKGDSVWRQRAAARQPAGAGGWLAGWHAGWLAHLFYPSSGAPGASTAATRFACSSPRCCRCWTPTTIRPSQFSLY